MWFFPFNEAHFSAYLLQGASSLRMSWASVCILERMVWVYMYALCEFLSLRGAKCFPIELVEPLSRNLTLTSYRLEKAMPIPQPFSASI